MTLPTIAFFRQIRFIGEYVRPHKKILVVSLVLSVLSTTLGMIQPYFAKILIDNVFMQNQASMLVPLISILIGLLVISFAVRVNNSYLYTKYSAQILFRMREKLFGHIHRIPLPFFLKQKIGDIYSRIATDMAEIQALVTETIPHFIFDGLTFIITVIILFGLNWKMALLGLVCTPAALYLVHRLQPKVRDLSAKMTRSNADIAHFLYESLSNTQLVRAFGAEQQECDKLMHKQDRVLKYLLRYQIIGAYAGTIPIFFMVVNTLVVFGYGGTMVLDGTLSVGSLVAFSIYQGRVFAPLKGLLDGLLAVEKSQIALERVGQILNIEPDQPRISDADMEQIEFKGDISFENVNFSYKADEDVLMDLSFRIPCGQTTALIGPSGAGKTTICHLLLRLFEPNAGRITIDGISLDKLPQDTLRKQIALVSQNLMLFHTTILENIRFADPEAEFTQIEAAAKAACIHEYILSLPEGYNTIIGDGGLRLSGGQRQRVSIARSILMKPKILILDEATAFLDASVESRLKDALQALMEDKTIIIVSHRSSVVQMADKIVAVDKAGIIYEGSAKAYIDDH